MKNSEMTLSAVDKSQCLDSFQLDMLERAFSEWTTETKRPDIKLSRMRIYLIFLLIRYTGGKLNEVLSIDPLADVDFIRRIIIFRYPKSLSGRSYREVQVPESLCRHAHSIISDQDFKQFIKKSGFFVDPGFVRRKFYERANACKIDSKLAAPEVIRKARAVELMVNNMPLPAVQNLLGHASPGLTAAHVTFSDNDIHEVIRLYMEKESYRKTSARNSFFGKIKRIRKGDIQSVVELTTMSSGLIASVITNDSLQRLGLAEGKIISAEVKAPWVILHKTQKEPKCSAENRFMGVVCRIHKGEINTEYVVRISDATELCAIVNSDRARDLDIDEQDTVWAVFNAYSVVLHLD